ncbi:MAG: diguanylate cyclase [Syntrophomonadaceae bacterium]|nr:diguanylate cyclase [Syntrophomonadaceae bacterium]
MSENFRKEKNNIFLNCLGSRKFWGIPLLVWAVLVFASLLWNLYSLRQNTLNTFKYEAKTLAGVALSTIMWTSQHERVYVPLTEWIPMEPFFSELPEREVVTTDGLRLTQVSHALISRQVAEQALLHGWEQKSIRMTSLQPLNPVNAPDDWEKDALKSFENEQTEKFTLSGDESGLSLKYMMSLRAKAECLDCHVDHREGDLLGGLSVSEQATSRLAMIKPQIISIIATHAGIFVIVAAVILFLLSYIRRQWLNLDQLNGEQKKMLIKLAESEAKLKEMAITDELTGLKNRRGFLLFAAQQIKEANRNKGRIWFIFIDVDGMKAVNDIYGHSEGDKALTATANIIKNTFRESDVSARIGGDEFVVMITGTTEINGCAIIERLQKNVDFYNNAAKYPYRLSLSAGIVDYDPGENPCSIEALLKKADELMYENKRSKTHCRNNCSKGISAIEPA